MDDVTATEHGVGIGPWARQLAEMNERFAGIEALLDVERRQRAAERRARALSEMAAADAEILDMQKRT